MRTIEVSGLVNAESGIGVIQRNLYPLLQQHFNVVEASTRGESRIRGAFRGLFAGRKGLMDILSSIATSVSIFAASCNRRP